MRRMNPPSLWESASFGPFAAAVPLIAGAAGIGGTTAALIGAGATIGSSLIAAHAQKKAAKSASSAQGSILSAPKPPTPAGNKLGTGSSPFSLGGNSIFGGTFASGSNRLPMISGSSAKKSLLG